MAITALAPLALGANKITCALNVAGFFYGMKSFWGNKGDMRDYLGMQDEIQAFEEYYVDDEE